ncbi:50S ribosomal protein L9 [Roseiarcus sp.]|uniref:50S ribosomal protein L9 n=1 Tax=Roseiarcus sp. TaxID=1969460 RepID=UPI003F99F01C
MDVILLERIGKLGGMGETVKVKDGYARNFLLPRGKALRATEANKKKFEAQRADLEARNHELKRTANEAAGAVDGATVVIIRQAGETGQLYGSVSARDIAEALTAAGHPVNRSHVAIQQPIKTLGMHAVPIHLHPEVEAKVTVNVARSTEQAERQAKGEDLSVREQTSMDDLGLEVGKALAEAGPGESLGRERPTGRNCSRGR